MVRAILLLKDGTRVELPFDFADEDEAARFIAAQPLPGLLEDSLKGWMIVEPFPAVIASSPP